MRVAVIGARQAHGGVGEHLARFCVEAGADVAALLGTSERTAHEAVATLAASTGHVARAIWEPAQLRGTTVDAIVIASPAVTHELWLGYALRQRLHVLCEKPLLWGGQDPGKRAASIARAFSERGLHLRVNAQWPFTLPSYEALFPDVAAKATSFYMRMSPSVAGPRMFLASLSHPLSILSSLCPDIDAEVLDPDVSIEPDGLEGRIQFVYLGAGRRLDCTVHLVVQPEPPREVAYGFDDCIASRVIHWPEYTLELEGDGRRIPLPDPMPLLVRSFLEAAATDGDPWIDPAAVPGMRHLVTLMAAMPAEDSPTP